MTFTILNPVGTIGGAERVLLSWAIATCAAFPRSRLTAMLLADGPLRCKLEEIGASVIVVPMPTALAEVGDTGAKAGGLRPMARKLFATGPSLWHYIEQLRAALSRENPSLIHSHGLKTHILASLARPRDVPVIWHLHDFYSERPAAKWAIKALRRSCATGVAISDAVQRDFAHVLPGAKCVTVQNTTDTDKFCPSGEMSDLDQVAGLPPASKGTVRVGLLATYANWKGHAVFLEAMAKISGTYPVRGYIIGGPIYTTAGSQVTKSELEHSVTKLALNGRIGFIPFQPDPAPIYRALDIVVHASTRPEPFGLTIVEAMSCGRAVVVSAAGGAVELFRDGFNAIGFQPGNTSQLAELIAKLVTDTELRNRLGREGRKSALHDFAPQRLPAQVEAIYRRVGCIS